MKIKLLRFAVILGRFVLNLLYKIMKIKKTKQKKVVLLSRQSNEKSLDFRILENALKDANYNVVCMCRFIEKKLISKINYCFYMLKVMNNLADSKICITDGYSIPVSLLNHKNDLIIIQIWHASGATKKFGYQVLGTEEGTDPKIAKIMRMHYNYDYVLAPSKKTGEFFSKAFNVDANKIKIIGLPRIDYLNKKDDELKSKFLRNYPECNNKKIVLYVPTFRKNNSVNTKELIENINKEKYKLIIRKHPLDMDKLDEENIVDNYYDTMFLLKIADYVITDYSAIAYEASIFNKPLYFYVYDIDEYKEKRGLNVDLTKEMRNATFKDAKALSKALEEKYDINELYKFRKKYMEVYNQNNIERLIKLIDNECKM